MMKWHLIIIGKLEDQIYKRFALAQSTGKMLMESNPDIWGVNITARDKDWVQWKGGYRRNSDNGIYWLKNKKYGK